MNSKVLIAIFLCVSGVLAREKTPRGLPELREVKDAGLVESPVQPPVVLDTKFRAESFAKQAMPELRELKDAGLVESPVEPPVVLDTRFRAESLTKRDVEVIPISGEGRAEPSLHLQPISERAMEKRGAIAKATASEQKVL
ncbi:uncharacterized protein LOC142349421 [Convolutriloba macropyga]|uniref:uncharacterized protein LOC142349421 n=1 Tax=Convolutriloba macropyga TaxID=536237 RepID=UPI003F524139